MDPVSVRFQYGNYEAKLETGRIARQASGAILSSMGDTVVLCTAVGRAGGEPRDFFPLTVDYQERTYLFAGKSLEVSSSVRDVLARKETQFQD